MTDATNRPQATARPDRPVTVLLLAHRGMNLLDLAGPLQALTTANRCAPPGHPPYYRTIVASTTGGLIATSSGLPVETVPLSSLADVAVDTLIAPGGCEGDEYPIEPDLAAWVGRRAPEIRRICSVCTGAFLLAAAGQLEGCSVATHWAWIDKLKGRHPSLQVDGDKIFVQDGRIWTSAGVSSGIDLTLALIEDDFGHRLAIDTARQLVVFMKRAGGQSQFSVPLAAQVRDDGFADLHGWMADNLRQRLSVEQLAERVNMAPRTFARAYTAKVGRTPAKMVEAMRLEAACRALEETSLPLKSVAASAGYGDEQRLRRAFQRQLGICPVDYRLRFSAHLHPAS